MSDLEFYSLTIELIVEKRTQHRLQRTLQSARDRQQLRRSRTGAFCQKCAKIEKELSSATLVAETADGGLKPPRLAARPAGGAEPFRWAAFSASMYPSQKIVSNTDLGNRKSIVRSMVEDGKS